MRAKKPKRDLKPSPADGGTLLSQLEASVEHVLKNGDKKGEA